MTATYSANIIQIDFKQDVAQKERNTTGPPWCAAPW